jgi:thiol-disulfide isomerase/thioredoxin
MVVTVYVKPDCTLCVPLMRIVEKVQADLGFEVEKVDISGDPSLTELYAHEIPVVLVNGRKAFKYRLTEQALRKRLKKERVEKRARPEAPIEALELLEAGPYVPPRPMIALFLALTMAAFGYFVWIGVGEAHEGRSRLAARLLKVDARDQPHIPLTLEAMTGGRVSLDDYKDKVVFLNFWATWCPPCIEEMPSMVHLYDRMKKDDRIVFLAVSADEGWDPVKKFFANRPPPEFKVLLDPSGKKAKEYGTTMFPETYVVVNGRIIGFIEGPRDWDQWFAEAYLRGLLPSRS